MRLSQPYIGPYKLVGVPTMTVQTLTRRSKLWGIFGAKQRNRFIFKRVPSTKVVIHDNEIHGHPVTLEKLIAHTNKVRDNEQPLDLSILDLI